MRSPKRFFLAIKADKTAENENMIKVSCNNGFTVKQVVRRQFPWKAPPEYTPEIIIRFFNDIEKHYHGYLEPSYELMKEYWAEKFEEKVRGNRISRYPSSGESLDKLDVQFNADSFVGMELERFGGFNWRFTVDDALEILRKCSRDSEYIDKDQFCDAMEKCVRWALNPPAHTLIRSRRTLSTQRVHEYRK